MPRMIVMLLALVVAAGLAAPAGAAEKIVVRLAHGASALHPFNEMAEMFKRSVEGKTDTVEIRIFGARQLGGDKQILEGTVAGTIDCSEASSVLYPLVVKKAAFDALQLPYLVNSYDNLGKMLSSDAAMKMLASLDDVGLKGLSIGEGGRRHFLNRDGAVQTLPDFKGLKTRIVPVPLHKAMWEAVGTNPVGIAYGEVYTSMQTHVIDAVEFNISSIESENLYEVAKDVSLTGHYFWPGVISCNKAKFDSLPAEAQTALVEAGREIIVPHVAYVKQHEKDAIGRLEAKGVKIYSFDDLAEMQALMAPIVEKWTAKDPLIGEYVAAARKLEGM